MDTHLRSQLLQTKHSQRWSLHPAPHSQELSRPFSRRHCFVLNRCCLPPAPKVPSSSAAFELGRQTSFAHLFKVSQVHAHRHTHSHTQARQWYPRLKQSKHWEKLQLCSTFSVKRTPLPHNQPAVQVLGLCIAMSQLQLSKFSVLSGRRGELRWLQELGQGKTFSRQTTAVGDRVGLVDQHRASVSGLSLDYNEEQTTAHSLEDRCIYLFPKHDTRVGHLSPANSPSAQ